MLVKPKNVKVDGFDGIEWPVENVELDSWWSGHTLVGITYNKQLGWLIIDTKTEDFGSDQIVFDAFEYEGVIIVVDGSAVGIAKRSEYDGKDYDPYCIFDKLRELTIGKMTNYQ